MDISGIIGDAQNMRNIAVILAIVGGIAALTAIAALIKIIYLRVNTVKIDEDIDIGKITASGIKSSYEVVVNIGKDKEYSFFIKKGNIVSYKNGNSEYKNYNS